MERAVKAVATLVAASIMIACLAAGGCAKGEKGEAGKKREKGEVGDKSGGDSTPYYFIAVHNEPYYGDPAAEQKMLESWLTLREMVGRADEHNVRLTLMFSAQYADFIAADASRLSELRSWKEAGHEIAAHHHGVHHRAWDGYSGYPQAEAQAIWSQGGGKPLSYLGGLDEFMSHVRALDPGVKSGCLNDEADKRELPDGIVYDTASGFANDGRPGTRMGDKDPRKAINRYVLVGTCNGIERKWLSHHLLSGWGREEEAAFLSAASGVFGVVVHSAEKEAAYLDSFLEFLASRDPGGTRSRTLTQVIEEGLLPEERLPDELVNRVYPNEQPSQRY